MMFNTDVNKTLRNKNA